MAQPVEHWFNRRYGMNRRDVYLLRTETGWQVLGRKGGADGTEGSANPSAAEPSNET
ncbi:hypothetical protein [Actinoplanes sp. NPDC049681]|uniref:hypothetical protein n=1 Tax=Actinoplanes sp. NPDC049681 TaxID=3363905 RepID=UPI00379048D1